MYLFVFQFRSSVFKFVSTCFRAALIKMFSPFGKIISEDFLWHTRGPKRGEPRGFAFIEYSSKEVNCLVYYLKAFVKQFLIFACKVSMQEAKLAKENMHGKLACSRPLVVRLASEKLVINTTNNNNTSRTTGETSKSRPSGSNYGHMSRSDKIAAIKNKLRALEGGEGERSGVKKQKQGQVSCRNNIDK